MNGKPAKPNTIEAKCIMGHKFSMTPKDIDTAKATGCAMCPTCGNPATITRVTVKA